MMIIRGKNNCRLSIITPSHANARNNNKNRLVEGYKRDFVFCYRKTTPLSAFNPLNVSVDCCSNLANARGSAQL